MSFIEFDPQHFDPEIDGPCDLVISVTRQAWNVLTSFGKVDEEDVEFDMGDLTYASLSTEAIDPLQKGRTLYFDQMPIINGEVSPEPGLMSMKIVRPTDSKLLRQIIFRLETHQLGAAIFYDEISDVTQVTDEEELLVLAIKLQQISDAYWCVAGEMTNSFVLELPISSSILALQAMLENEGQ